MKKYVLILLLAVGCMALGACSNNQGKQQLETAQFEEKQNNREHAIKLYEEVVTKYPGSPNAKRAQDRLIVLRGGT
jgi:protein involved in sex pheromone biosynthesis